MKTIFRKNESFFTRKVKYAEIREWEEYKLLRKKTVEWVMTQEFKKYGKEDAMYRDRLLSPRLSI